MQDNKKGFSLLDTVVTIFISALLLVILTSNIPNYNKILQRIQSKLGFEEKMIVFFLQLEEDFFSSILDNHSKANITNSLSFEGWLWNNDNASFDKKTSSYQFQENTKQIRRKIGAEINFTSLLQQVENFEYETIQQQNLFCLKITIQSVFDAEPRRQVFCRHF